MICKGRIFIGVLLILLGGVGATRAQQPSVAAAAAPPPAETLTLERALRLALDNNNAVKNARLETDKYEGRLGALRTRRLPSFKVSTLVSQPLTRMEFRFEKGAFGDFAETGPIPDEDTTISSPMTPTALVTGQVTQPLSQLFSINLSIRQMEVSREISVEEARLKEQATVNDVKRAYYALLQTQGAFESAEESIRLYRELDRVAGEHVVQQVALKTDQLEVQTRLAKAEYELLTLENQLAAQKEQLNHLMGRDVRTDFAVADGLNLAQYVMRETDLSAARERALARRPEVLAARLRVRQAEYDRRIKKAEYIPDVSLAVNYVSPFGYNGLIPKNIASVGVQVEWEVFDWGRRKRELSEKTLAVEQADNSVRDAENMVLMEVSGSYRRLQESSQMLRVAKLSQESARAGVAVISNRYRLQSALFKDVLQAQTTLADANYDYRKALLSFWTAKADLEKAMGEDK